MKSFKNLGVFFFMVFAVFQSPASANNLRIENVTLEDRDPANDTAVVEFDISWDNSWKDDTNHDAVWVFLKACEDTCTSVGWEHGALKTAGLNPTDTSPGSNPDLLIRVPTDKVGAFLSRASSGTGTFSSNNVRLTLDYSSFGAADSDQIRVKVFGVEMVYIPEGSFYIGDGNGTNESSYAFHETTLNSAIQITNALYSSVRVDGGLFDDFQLIGSGGATGVGIDGDGGLDRDDDSTIDNPGFPVGYSPFYLMKYELSQGEWRDFFNTLTQDMQDNRCDAVLSGNDANTYIMVAEGEGSVDARQTIKPETDPTSGPYTVGCDLDDDNVVDEYNDGASIAMNHIYWPDVAAYADWAGLRPMTETEYEKACRGTQSAVYGEGPWGTTDFTQAEDPILNSGEGSEVATTTGDGLCNYNGAGSDVGAPLRSGFAATSSTTRVSAGAGYYGNMEMAGNLRESAVTLGQEKTRDFAGTHGDGTLNSTATYEGNATNLDWPGIDATTNKGVTGYASLGNRGGTWNDSSLFTTTSNRTYASTSYTLRNSWLGIRVARSEPLSEWKVQTMTASSWSTEDNTDCLADIDWANTSNAQDDDNSYATATFAGPDCSDFLVGTDFNFSLPTDATDIFIVAEVEIKCSQASTNKDQEVTLWYNNAELSGADMTRADYYSTSSNIWRYYTDGNDWQTSATIVQINASSFGVGFSADGADGGGGETTSIDQMKLTIFYKGTGVGGT